jgi:hypothetical protein
MPDLGLWVHNSYSLVMSCVAGAPPTFGLPVPLHPRANLGKVPDSKKGLKQSAVALPSGYPHGAPQAHVALPHPPHGPQHAANA